ncbi:DUF5711 family protein [Jingyaoa shaoxingensis]|uniref:Uncharacterized protein n=1 Tax=Jingyaoa shaoxingensis TaxID=2763671 RepID=A0ABR7N813_9FIRM|nr:DUF5711 family protein [Jingyaoa shaoxingensis]MBC8572528.1 hypothetical protein [Jingyaoa shaoxingensis]
MNFLNKLKKEKETDAEKVKPIHSERKFSFQDALGNLRSAVFGKAVNIKELYKKKADQNMQSDEMLDLSSKLRLHKNKVRIRTAVILTIVLVASVGYGVYHHVKVYRHYTLVSGEERSDDNATQYVFLKKGCILKCNPNGVTCVNKSNEVQWNTTFTMQNPILDICGTTVAVADQRGNEVYIFNENGLVGNFKVEYTLTKIRVAKQGVVAAVLEDGDVTWINVYDSQGNIIVKNKTSIGKAGYPLDMDISSDGLKMAVSFAGIQNQMLNFKVDFYNFSSVGKDQENNLVKEVEYENSVIPQVQFLGGDYAVAFRDDGVTVFSGKHVPEEKKNIAVGQEIVSTFYDDDYFGIITESDEEEQTHRYKMELYRKNGTKCFQTYFDMEYSEVKIHGEEVFLYNSSETMIYTTAGKLKYSAAYDKQISEVIPAEGLGKYMIITPDSVDIIKIG